MNFRNTQNHTEFPKRDDVPADILMEMDCSEDEYAARCCIFFTAIFQTLCGDLSGQPDDPMTIQEWNDQMCNLDSQGRVKFFQKVKQAYEEVSTTNHSGLTKTKGNYRTFLRYQRDSESNLRKQVLCQRLGGDCQVMQNLDQGHPKRERLPSQVNVTS
jgi:hypothetical protein